MRWFSVFAVAALLVACSGDDADDGPGFRIDGPAQVDEERLNQGGDAPTDPDDGG